MTTPTTEVPKFSEWLAEFARGALDDRLTAALADVAQAVRLHGKGGTVTLKLKLSDKGDGVIVEDDVVAAPPKPKAGGRFFYVHPSGALSTRDPSQPQLHDPDPDRPVKTDLEDLK